MRKTKIVCTMGPASNSESIVEQILVAGMDIMRLNFSHGDFEEHIGRVNNLRKITERTGRSALVLQDLSGPKMRIGVFDKEQVNLKEGNIFTLTTEEIIGDETKVSVNYKPMPKEVSPGHIIYIEDARKQLMVEEVKGNNIICKIVIGGMLGWKRGINLPDSKLSTHALTEKDKKDLEFGIEQNVDFIALSFVRKAEDVEELKSILNHKGGRAKVVAKVETREAIANIDQIIAISDCIMVARGDLGVEVGLEKVPMIQKEIIKKCNEADKFVITATQMLESMEHSLLPTRAEVSDIANAVLDGADALMLSGETALGEHPSQAVEIMAKIIKEIERSNSKIPNYSLNTESISIS